MSPIPINETSGALDLSQRVKMTTAITGSPALAAETIIATLVLNTDETFTEGVHLRGWAAFTVGTSGTAVQFRIRRTNVAGTVVADSGALTATAATLRADSIMGLDIAPALTGQTYVLTLQVTAGAAASTVTATALEAIAV